MYKAFSLLRNHLASPLLIQAWLSINRCTFAVVIVTTVHNLWILLLHWHEAAEQQPVFFMPGGVVHQNTGAGPYTPDYPLRSFD